MTDQDIPDPHSESAEELMDWAATRLRHHMDTALAAIDPQRELLANLVHAGLVPPPPHDAHDSDTPAITPTAADGEHGDAQHFDDLPDSLSLWR